MNVIISFFVFFFFFSPPPLPPPNSYDLLMIIIPMQFPPTLSRGNFPSDGSREISVCHKFFVINRTKAITSFQKKRTPKTLPLIISANKFLIYSVQHVLVGREKKEVGDIFKNSTQIISQLGIVAPHE